MHRPSLAACARHIALVVAAALVVSTGSSGPVLAGGASGDQYFDVAQGQVVRLGAATDSLSSSAAVSGTRGWWANYQNQGASTVTNANVTIASGYPAPGFNANGAPLASFPATSSAASVPPGGGIFVGLGSTVPVSGTPPFDSSRSVDATTVSLDGITQTTTVTLTLTDPTYAANGHYSKVRVQSTVPGASVVATSASALVGGEILNIVGQAPNNRTFVMNNGVLGHTYVFTITFAVPNPYALVFTNKPDVSVLYAYAPVETPCATCTTGMSTDVSTLDGATPGSGSMSVSIDQTSTWRSSTTTTFSVDYAPTPAPAPPALPPVCSTLADCPFTGPLAFADGLVRPNAIGTDVRGDLYVSEKPGNDLATLTRISAHAAAGTGTEVYRVSSVTPFTDPTIGSPSFDAVGNAYVVVAQHVAGDLLQVRRAIVRIDRRTGDASEIFVAEGADPALGQPASAGIAADRDGTVYFGRYNALYALAPDGSLTTIATFAATARVTSWPLIEVDGSLVVIVQDGGLSAVYSVRRNGDVVRIAHVLPAAPGVTGFGNLGADAAGNVFMTQRVPHLFRGFSCAFSTTVRILRIDGRAVRTATSEVVPAEVGSTTQAGHLGLVGSDQTFFRVSTRGDVFLGVYPFVPFCPPTPLPPYPQSNQASARRLMAFAAQPDGTLAAYLLMDLPGLTVGADRDHVNFGAFALADWNRELLVVNGGAGDVARFDR